MEKEIEYKSKRMILLIIYNSIYLACFIISFFYLKNKIVLSAIILYCLYLIYELLWTCLGKLNLTVKNECFIIKKKLFSYSISNKKFLFKNIEKANLLKDVGSSKRLGYPGKYFNLKYDYCIELIFKKGIKSYQFDVNNKENGEKIMRYLNNDIRALSHII